MLDIALRTIVILLFVGRYIYWKIEQKKAEKALPKIHRPLSLHEEISKYVYILIQLLIIAQLIAVPIDPITQSVLLFQLIGVTLVILGVGICFVARREIASNWVSGEEYQIKKGQKLVTTGIYSLIRHPIYLGFALSFIGGELTAQSYLFVVFLPYLISGYVQGKREEKLLIAHFGDAYKTYMKKTKMFVPYIF